MSLVCWINICGTVFFFSLEKNIDLSIWETFKVNLKGLTVVHIICCGKQRLLDEHRLEDLLKMCGY